MDVENLGEAVVAQLVEAGKARDVGELYALSEENLLGLEGFAEKSAENLIAALESSKTQELWRLINGIGIKHVGAAAAKDLARELGSLDAIAKADAEALVSIEGIGSIMAESIQVFFKEEKNRELIATLENRGLRVEEKRQEVGSLPWIGRAFVLTGSLVQMTRQEAGDRIEALGGKVSASVSKKTRYLVAGPGAGSKLAKAEMLAVEVLDEAAFLAMLAEHGD